MKEIEVSSLPLKALIKEMASQFGVKYSGNCDIYSVELPESIGTGNIVGANLPNGLGLIFYDCSLRDELTVHFNSKQIHPVKFMYLLEGSLLHNFEKSDEQYKIEPHQNVIVASAGRSGHRITFPRNQQIKMTSLEVDREKFVPHLMCELSTAGSELRTMFLDVEASEVFEHQGNYSLKMFDILSLTKPDGDSSLLKKLYLEGLAMQILYEQILLYSDDLKETGMESIMRSKDVELVHEAARLILEQLQSPVNITELARQVGTNSNKLQSGFRSLYDNTVNGYVQEARLTNARDLLIASDMNISEIVERIGLSNKGYFSKIFKERYGIAPRKFREKYRAQFA